MATTVTSIEDQIKKLRKRGMDLDWIWNGKSLKLKKFY